MKTALVVALWLSIVPVSPAHAYIGPGIGAGTIGVVFGVIGSILVALFANIWYPIKRALKRRKAARAGGGDDVAKNDAK